MGNYLLKPKTEYMSKYVWERGREVIILSYNVPKWNRDPEYSLWGTYFVVISNNNNNNDFIKKTMVGKKYYQL